MVVEAEEDEDEGEADDARAKKGEKGRKKARSASPAAEPRAPSTAEELALVAASDNPGAEPKHFDMKAVLKAEKAKGKKKAKN